MINRNAKQHPKNCLRVRAVVPLAALLFLVSHPLSAAEEHIVCDFANPDAISQTLGVLDAVGPHHIFVQGDCFDSVHIANRNGVIIEAEGAGATISPPNDMNPFAVAISSARGITLINLVFTNKLGVTNSNGIFIDNNSAVEISHGTIEGSISDGITVSGQSFLRLDSTTIQNNDANGLTAIIGSTVQMGGGIGMNIINNGGNGIDLTAGTLHVVGLLTVENNGGSGLVLRVGSRATVNSETGPNTFSNNGGNGIELSEGTLRSTGSLTVELNGIDGLNLRLGSSAGIEGGPNTFSSNSRHGVVVTLGSTIEFLGGSNSIANNARNGIVVLEDGTARFLVGSAVIEGNGRWGVFVVFDSGVRFIGAHQILSNGSLDIGGGVIIANNSSFVMQNGTNVSDNIGIGVQLEIDASATFRGGTISNNTKEGVLLGHITVGEFFLEPTAIFDNGTAIGGVDVACDDTSIIFGELQGIVVNTCNSFLQSIASISDQVQAIVASAPGSPLADKVEDVRDKFRVAVVELNKTPPDNQAAVGNIEGAVGDVQAAVDDGVLDPALGDLLMDQLAGVAKQIASNAIEQATAGGGDSDKIADAVMARADGDALLASPTYKDAVNKYKDAVSIAEGA